MLEKSIILLQYRLVPDLFLTILQNTSLTSSQHSFHSIASLLNPSVTGMIVNTTMVGNKRWKCLEISSTVRVIKY